MLAKIGSAAMRRASKSEDDKKPLLNVSPPPARRRSSFKSVNSTSKKHVSGMLEQVEPSLHSQSSWQEGSEQSRSRRQQPSSQRSGLEGKTRPTPICDGVPREISCSPEELQWTEPEEFAPATFVVDSPRKETDLDDGTNNEFERDPAALLKEKSSKTPRRKTVSPPLLNPPQLQPMRSRRPARKNCSAPDLSSVVTMSTACSSTVVSDMTQATWDTKAANSNSGTSSAGQPKRREEFSHAMSVPSTIGRPTLKTAVKVSSVKSVFDFDAMAKEAENDSDVAFQTDFPDLDWQIPEEDAEEKKQPVGFESGSIGSEADSSSAAAAAVSGHSFVHSDRSAWGVPALKRSKVLDDLARLAAEKMAKKDGIIHSDSEMLARVIDYLRIGNTDEGGASELSTLGENTGCGTCLKAIQADFMRKETSREITLDPGFTEFGMGIAYVSRQKKTKGESTSDEEEEACDRKMYVCQLFIG